MKNSEFATFRKFAMIHGLSETAHMGFAWANMTERQVNMMCDIADTQGIEPIDGKYQLGDGIEFERIAFTVGN